MSEEQDQISVVQWMGYKHPDLAEALHHSPNGGVRDARTGAKMKKMGTRPGFPDLVLYENRGEFAGLVIEMKSAKGRLTPSQKRWAEILKRCRYQVTTAYSTDEAIKTIEEYLA